MHIDALYLQEVFYMCMPPCNATVRLLLVLYCSTAGGLAGCSLIHGDDDSIHAYLVAHAYLCIYA